jgi:hypothetical protein
MVKVFEKMVEIHYYDYRDWSLVEKIETRGDYNEIVLFLSPKKIAKSNGHDIEIRNIGTNACESRLCGHNGRIWLLIQSNDGSC